MAEQDKRIAPLVIACSHKVGNALKKEVTTFDMPVVFRAPNKLGKVCVEVNKNAENSYRSIKIRHMNNVHARGRSACQFSFVWLGTRRLCWSLRKRAVKGPYSLSKKDQ